MDREQSIWDTTILRVIKWKTAWIVDRKRHKKMCFWQLLNYVIHFDGWLHYWTLYRQGHRSIFYKFCGPLAKELSSVRRIFKRYFHDVLRIQIVAICGCFSLSCGRAVHLKIYANVALSTVAESHVFLKILKNLL